MNPKLQYLLVRFVSAQNRFQQMFGHLVAWGMVTLVLLASSVVILRYGFDTGSIALQEAVMYNHALLFMLGMSYTLLQGQHVRVDVFYTRYSQAQKAWVNLIGGLVLALPTVVFIFVSGWDYVAASWQIQERSAEAGGLAYLYLLKTLILIMAALLGLQIVSLMVESLLRITEPKAPVHCGSEPPRDDLKSEGKL